MKNTNDIGKVYRYLPEYNYRALWEDKKQYGLCWKVG